MSERRPIQGLWVIFDGATPTAFRGRDREALEPTLYQLRRTQPNVTLRWFERGRVWDSPEAARLAAVARRQGPRSKRPEGWRPGGEHRDPRARFALTRTQKRARFKARLGRPPRRSGPKGPKGSK